MNDLINPMNSYIEGTDIMLEPRLLEYLKKKEVYKKNNIEPVVSLESTYGITKDDITKIKGIMKNGLYKNNELSKNIYQNISLASIDTTSILDEQFSQYESGFWADNIKDKKFKDLLKKQKKIKKKEEEIKNTILARQGNDDNNDNNDNNNYNLINKNNKNKNNKNRIYNVPPKIEYNQLLHYGDNMKNSNINYNEIIGSYDSYRKQVTPAFESTSDFRPNVRSNNKKNIDTSGYKPMPYVGYNVGECDKIEMIKNEPIKTRKSYGYTNAFESQFQYIDKDIQSVEHTIMPGEYNRGGEDTRRHNKEKNKLIYRIK